MRSLRTHWSTPGRAQYSYAELNNYETNCQFNPFYVRAFSCQLHTESATLLDGFPGETSILKAQVQGPRLRMEAKAYASPHQKETQQ